MSNPLQQFVFILPGAPDPVLVDLLMSGCDDATVEVGPVQSRVAFDRRAPSLVDAIVSAMRDVTAARLDPSCVCVDDDLVTLEVIAQRLDSTPARVAGEPGFPAPVVPHPQRPVYSWRQVAAGRAARGAPVPPDGEPTVRLVNQALELRRTMPRVERGSGIRALFWT